MKSGFAGRRDIESALLDFHRSPGQYAVSQRRPQLLFASIREVLHLAGGRMPDGGVAPSLPVQLAAAFFVRCALLHPAADHYALLGLERSANASTIKERYRQMMRLMHPDFADAVADGVWPADAASRINQAYEVLASAAQRRGYDEQLAGDAPAPKQRPAPMHPALRPRTAAPTPAQDRRTVLRRIAGAFGVLATLALIGSLLALGTDRDSLVQRAIPTAPPLLASAKPVGSHADASSRTTPIPAPAAVAFPLDSAPASDAGPPAPDLSPVVAPAAIVAASAALPEPMRATPDPVVTEMPLRARAPQPEPGRIRAASLDAAQGVAAAQLPTRFVALPLDADVVSPAPAVLIAQATLAPAAAAALPPASANGLTLPQAHALLSNLLQQMETGSGERLLAVLDRSVRNTPSAQALLRQYTGLVEGARSVKIANVQLKAEPHQDRLLVKGQVLLELADRYSSQIRDLPLEAEFARRNGAVVMTRLGPGPSTR